MANLSDWNGLSPAAFEIKTVAGLCQAFELVFVDAGGDGVSLDGLTFRGAVNTAPVREFSFVTDGNKVSFYWPGLEVGSHSFDVFMVAGGAERALISGTMSVMGRTLPPPEGEDYTVNDAATVVVPTTSAGDLVIELSEVGVMDFLCRRASAYAGAAAQSADEAKVFSNTAKGHADRAESLTDEVAQAVSNALDDIGDETAEAVSTINSLKDNATEHLNQVEADIVSTLAQEKSGAVTAVETAQAAATVAVYAARDNAIADVESQQSMAEATLSGLVDEAQAAETAAETAAGSAATAATNAQAEATNATNAKAAAEAARDEAVAARDALPSTDAGGNVVIDGGLTVGGVVNANGGVNVPVAPDSDTSVTRRCDFSYPVSMFARGCAPNSIAFYIRAGVNLGAPGYYAKKGAPLFLTEMRSFDNADSNYYAWHTYTQAVDIPTKRGNSVNVCYNNKEGYSPRPRFNFGLSRIMPNKSLNSVNESSFIYPIFSEGSASESSNAIASYWPFNMAADRKDRIGFQQASPVLSASTLKSFLYAQLPSSAVRLIYWRKHNGGKKTNCFLFTQSLSGEVMLIGSVDLIYNYNAGALFLSGFYTAGVQDNWAMHDIDVFGCDAIVNANGIAFTSPNWPIEQSLFIPPADGGDCVVVLTCADKSYTLLDYPEWVTVSEGAGELNVSVAANESGTEREGFINLTLFNGITYSVLIHQGA